MKKKANKEAPDGNVYLTKDGTRVRIGKAKQFANHPSDPVWMKEIRAKSNEAKTVIRISDGHELWGYKIEDLTPVK